MASDSPMDPCKVKGVCLPKTPSFPTAAPATSALFASASPIIKDVPLSDEHQVSSERLLASSQLKKRHAQFLTTVDDAGDPYSFSAGPIKLSKQVLYLAAAFLVATSILFYFLVGVKPRTSKSGSPTPLPIASSASTAIHGAPEVHAQSAAALDTSSLPATASQLASTPHLIPQSQPPSPSPSNTWQVLVFACGGDPVRAGTLIAAEVAADPSLGPGSTEAIKRSILRVLQA